MIYTINGASYDSNYLAHHGIKGMKWGVRRYQNPDGSLTAAGRKRYGVGDKIQKAGQYAKASAKMAGRMSDYALKNTILKKSLIGRIYNYKGDANRANPIHTYSTAMKAVAVRPMVTAATITGLKSALVLSAAMLSASNPAVIAGAASVADMLTGVMIGHATLETIEDYAKLGKDYIALAKKEKSSRSKNG